MICEWSRAPCTVLVLLWVTLASMFVCCYGDKEKRPILSDHSDVQQQLTQFQTELQTLRVKVQTQNGEITTLRQGQNAKVDALNQQLSQTQQDVQTLQILLQRYSDDNGNIKQQLLQNQQVAQNQDVEITTLKQNLSASLQDVQGKIAEITNLKQLLTKTNEEVEKQDVEITLLKQNVSQTHQEGAMFVRWGRAECPSNNWTELVYNGYAAGSAMNQTGSAAEYVCLPRDPQLGAQVAITNNTGRMYGAQYQSRDIYTAAGPNPENTNVPCAVCRSANFASSVMIPARTQCYRGWTEAYRGKLSSGGYSQVAASQFVCVDDFALPLDVGGGHFDIVKVFVSVKTECGALRCPPYVQDNLLSCVVCMK